MTLSNWIEVGAIILTVICLGLPLLRASKKVRDLEGAELVVIEAPERDDYLGTVISSK